MPRNPAIRLLTALFFAITLLAACGEADRRPLPFPTPGKENLVVLIRPGPLTYRAGDEAGGFERDLIEAFALELGVGVDYVVAEGNDFAEQIAAPRFHLAAGWLSPLVDDNPAVPAVRFSPPIFSTRDVVARSDASLPLERLDDLAGRTVHVRAGSRQAATLHALQARLPDLRIVDVSRGSTLDLMEQLGEGPVEYVVVDEMLADIARQFFPSLTTGLALGEVQPVAWLLGPAPNPELQARLAAFIDRARQDGTLARLQERYFGHLQRLQPADIETYLADIESVLPRFRPLFETAARITSLDWRLIAALAYQESHWNPLATSPTGVRGMMMLTEETADRLGVSNRLDSRESILAGARYLNLLKGMLPDDTPEPDRTWLALAAYNLGPGHLNAARRLARQKNADPDAWIDMRRILPLLARPEYYERLKSGRARGGEAVILVENVRSFYDILARHEQQRQVRQP